MKIVSTVSALCVAALLAPSPVWAYGAIAVGGASDVIHSGFAYGVSKNSPTEDSASAEALNKCRTTTASGEEAHRLCTVVTTFHNQCVVVAMDPAAGTPGVGWAVAPDVDAATQTALANCMATAGEARKQFCTRSTYQCDGQ